MKPSVNAPAPPKSFSSDNPACPVCEAGVIEFIPVNYPFFGHLDYTTLRPNGAIGRCNRCQALIQRLPEQATDPIQELLGTAEYARSKQTDQTFTVADFPKPITRSFLQAVLITRAEPRPHPAVLDIGAFDGRLLAELKVRLPGAELHAFDVNPHLRSFYAATPDIRFWSPNLAAVDGGFDIICMSHSMMYEKSTAWLMRQVDRLLRSDGLLYIQVPDITASPCYILMGDQCYYYTADILRNTLQHFGFSFTRLETEWFPREVAGIARRTGPSTLPFAIDRHIYECLQDLGEKAAKLRRMGGGKGAAVLGTTANAAFVDTLLGDQVLGFFDENPHRVGTLFRGKDVLHPRSLKASDLLIIPYGTSGERIQQRFNEQYPCACLVI